MTRFISSFNGWQHLEFKIYCFMLVNPFISGFHVIFSRRAFWFSTPPDFGTLSFDAVHLGNDNRVNSRQRSGCNFIKKKQNLSKSNLMNVYVSQFHNFQHHFFALLISQCQSSRHTAHHTARIHVTRVSTCLYCSFIVIEIWCTDLGNRWKNSVCWRCCSP